MKVYDRVVSLVYEDQFVQAEKLTPSITDQKIQSRALLKISIGYSFAKKWDHAKRVAFSIKKPLVHSITISCISSHLFRDGKLEESKELRLWMTDTRNFSRDIYFCVFDLLEEEKIQEAKSLAIWISEPRYRGVSISQIFYYLFKKEKIEEALGVAVLHPDQKVLNSLVWKIIRYHISKQEEEKAEKILSLFPEFKLDGLDDHWMWSVIHQIGTTLTRRAHDVVIQAIKMNKPSEVQQKDLNWYFYNLRKFLGSSVCKWEAQKIKKALDAISDNTWRITIMEIIEWGLCINGQWQKSRDLLDRYKK